MKRLKFLIAHENPVFRKLVKRYLEQRGCRAYLAGSAIEARAIANLETPDVVVAQEGTPIEGLCGTRATPLTIFLSEDLAVGSAETSGLIGRTLRLSKGEFIDLLALGGPLLLGVLLNSLPT